MGYLNDYSMSERAAEAYRNGEMPLSKWTKKAILDAIADDGYSALAAALKNRKYTLAFLKDQYLTNSSWHHTSCKYNCTDFYSVDLYGDESDYIEEIDAQFEKWSASDSNKNREKEISAWRKGKLLWQQWEQRPGRRGRYVKQSAAGWVRQEGNWLCLYTGRGKNKEIITRRSLTSNSNPHFER